MGVNQHHIAHNEGNAGAFITWVQMNKKVQRGYIIFTNAATTQTAAGIDVLMEYLRRND